MQMEKGDRWLRAAQDAGETPAGKELRAQTQARPAPPARVIASSGCARRMRGINRAWGRVSTGNRGMRFGYLQKLMDAAPVGKTRSHLRGLGSWGQEPGQAGHRYFFVQMWL